jgi:hypothetical protein
MDEPNDLQLPFAAACQRWMESQVIGLQQPLTPTIKDSPHFPEMLLRLGLAAGLSMGLGVGGLDPGWARRAHIELDEFTLRFMGVATTAEDLELFRFATWNSVEALIRDSEN